MVSSILQTGIDLLMCCLTKKTFSLLGKAYESAGVIEKSVVTLCNMKDAESKDYSYRFSVSMFQLHNDNVYDILNFNGKPVNVRFNGNRPDFSELSNSFFENVEDFKALMRRKEQNMSEYKMYNEFDRRGTPNQYHQIYLLKVRVSLCQHDMVTL
jgi:hypothetical protein